MKHSKNPESRRRFRLRRRAESASPQPIVNRQELIQTTKQRAIQAGEAILTAAKEEMHRGEHTYLEAILEQYVYHTDVVAVADAAMASLGQDHPAATAQKPEPPDIPTYVISSWFMTECATYLLSHSDGFELLHLVTGSKIGTAQRTLERMIKVALEAHSPVNAQANQQDLQKLLIEFSGWGHTLHGLFHSHPGYGKDATQPSGIDLGTQKLYEQGGYPLVSAIFSRDGFVRFFSNNPINISVFGAGVEQHEEHIFKIQTLERHLPVQTPQNKEGWAGVSRR
jgi:proteasome lid subunit RPN8/RPN11